MSALMNKPFKLQQDNQNYVFSVCSSAGNPCMENDGKFNDAYSYNIDLIPHNIYICTIFLLVEIRFLKTKDMMETGFYIITSMPYELERPNLIRVLAQ